jgi:2,3-bisphosphoglycerate-independent phosphoglycerate mutase
MHQDPVSKVALVVLDGAALAPEGPGNAVTPRTLPTLFQAMQEHGHAALQASGPAVGLEEGQIGNSEVGHLTLGLGRVQPSALSRINTAYMDGSWRAHALWDKLADAPRLHVVGMLSDAGVHAHLRTIWQAAELAVQRGIPDVVVHPILDGVDSQAGTAAKLLEVLREKLSALGAGVRLGVVMGRKWFADRSGGFELTDVFAAALQGEATLPAFSDALLQEHMAEKNESTFPAHLVEGGTTIAAGDNVIVSSHRADRARQSALALGRQANVHALVTLDDAVPEERVFYPTQAIEDGLATALGRHGISPVRIAEDCKFPHVTFFFNGFRESLDERQVRLPGLSETPEERPEMALAAVTDAIVETMLERDARGIVANLANLDQVGHCGRIEVVREAAGHVENALARIVAAARRQGWTLVLTADHGNADRMLDDEGRPVGSHSGNPVPFTVIPAEHQSLEWTSAEGGLSNVAATILALFGLPRAEGMDAPLLRVHRHERATT